MERNNRKIVSGEQSGFNRGYAAGLRLARERAAIKGESENARNRDEKLIYRQGFIAGLKAIEKTKGESRDYAYGESRKRAKSRGEGAARNMSFTKKLRSK